MKPIKFLIISLFIATITWAMNDPYILLAAHHPICEDARTGLIPECNVISQFYVDQNGRCGCLTGSYIAAPEHCANGPYCADGGKFGCISPSTCGSERPYAELYEYAINPEVTQLEFAGCSCLGTMR